MSGIQQIYTGGFPGIGAGTGDGSSAANAGSSAVAIKQRTGTTTDGLYWIKPPNGSAVQVWCDMNTAGGGWILIARTHPTDSAVGAGTWGWNSTTTYGSPTTYTTAYHLGVKSLYNNGMRFHQYIFGNQVNNISNNWGPFIYQVSCDMTAIMTVDSQQSGSDYRVLKNDPNIYYSTTFPGMQGAIGFPVTGTTNNIVYMRDCCGFAGYGITPNGMTTTYCSSDTVQNYCGPWCNGATLSGNTYVQGGSNTTTNTGGTSQCMLMVR
jgi:hypothetical protein